MIVSQPLTMPLAGPCHKLGVLVVDDDEGLLILLQRVLQKHGFAVWSAPNGASALELYRRQRAQIQVVLLDVRMPGMDGPSTLAELQRINAGVACCFMSGCTGDYGPTELLGRGARHVFEKPFHIDEMVRVLSGFADRQASSA
jgi:DNA-binding response OmpR family regulator